MLPFSRTVLAVGDLVERWSVLLDRDPVRAKTEIAGEKESDSRDRDLAAGPRDDGLSEWLATLCRQAGLEVPEFLALRACDGEVPDASAKVVQVAAIVQREKLRCQMLLDQQSQKKRAARLLLDQYQRQWIAGVRNLVEQYSQKRITAASMAALLDAQKPGPKAESFLTAFNVAAVGTKVNEYLTDRLADLVAGLSGLANKLELSDLLLGEKSVTWNPKSLPARLAKELAEKHVFPSGSSKRSGLVSTLTGKKQVIVDERKGQLAKGIRIAVHEIETDFATWCVNFIKGVEIGINHQLERAFESHHEETELQLRARVDRLTQAELALQTPPTDRADRDYRLADWFRLLASRRWIPSHRGQS